VGTEEKKRNYKYKQRREEILKAARRVFASKGYRRTKVEDIADFLGVGKGTLYRYFKSKKTLFLSVFSAGIEDLMKVMNSRIVPITNPAERVKKAPQMYFNFFDENKDFIEILMQVRSEFKEEYRRMHLKMYEVYSANIERMLRQGVEMGIYREDIDVEKTAEVIGSIMPGILQGFYLRQLAADSEGGNDTGQRLVDRADAVSKLILDGLRKHSNE